MFSFVFTHEETAELEYGYYVFDIEIKIAEYFKTVVHGKINLLEEVTTINNE